jgi:hypothetical protein
MPLKTSSRSRTPHAAEHRIGPSRTTRSRPSTRPDALPRLAVCGGLLASLVLVGAGCAHLNNPYKDSGALIETEMTTASTEGYQGRAEFGQSPRRNWAASQVRYENGAVSHWPLWFEDPFEDKGNAFRPVADRDAPDNEFARNWVDYLHIPYGPGRMIFLNAALWPASAIVTPPGTLMESNGRIDKGILWHDHDAKRSDSVTREPPDVNIIKKEHLHLQEAPDAE